MKHKVVGSIPYFSFCYTHFAIEHTGGHHKEIATPTDPVSHLGGTSMFRGIMNACIYTQYNTWLREFDRIRKHSIKEYGCEPSYFSLLAYNLMFLYACMHAAMLTTIYAVFGYETLKY